AYAAMPTLIMRSVPPTETAAANGLNAVMRTLGSSIAATVVGIVLSMNFVESGGVEIPTREAFQVVFGLGAVVTLVGVGFALFIPRRPPSYDTSSIPVQRG